MSMIALYDDDIRVCRDSHDHYRIKSFEFSLCATLLQLNHGCVSLLLYDAEEYNRDLMKNCPSRTPIEN